MKIVYVLSDAQDGHYARMSALSAASVRRVAPSSEIEALIPAEQLERHRGTAVEKAVDRLRGVPCPYATPVECSRFLKTTMRRHVEGDFVFLDCDTLVMRPFDDIWEREFDLAGVLDRCVVNPSPGFPAGKAPLFDQMDWKIPTIYLNSGVLAVRDTPQAHQLFEAWNERWRRCREAGILVDQPALNSLWELEVAAVCTLPDRYNAMIDAIPGLARGAAILHFYTKNGRPGEDTLLAAMLNDAEAGRDPNWDDWDRCRAFGHPWGSPYKAWRLRQSGNLGLALRVKWEQAWRRIFKPAYSTAQL